MSRIQPAAELTSRLAARARLAIHDALDAAALEGGDTTIERVRADLAWAANDRALDLASDRGRINAGRRQRIDTAENLD